MSYYDVLGITFDATDEDIRAAYKVMSQETLMDTEAFESVQTAYETLISPVKRAAYDVEVQPQDVTTVEEPPRKPGTAPLRRNIAAPASAAADVTRAFLSVVCPVCNHKNSLGDRYCTECGFLLSGIPEDQAPPPAKVELPETPRLETFSGIPFIIKPGLNRVGRENADILIFDKTVSRYHALLVFDEERNLLSVEDAGSSNGTKVNDFLLPPRSSHPLVDADTVSFGSAKFKLFAPAHAESEENAFEDDDGPREMNVTLPPVQTVPTARLTLQRGRGPHEVLLVPGTITIGRLSDNHISLPGDRYVSGHHAQVVVEETVYRLIDVGSTNGSFLNGLRLTTNESIAMSDGDELMIGSTVFQFQIIKKKDEPDGESDETDNPEEPVASEISDVGY